MEYFQLPVRLKKQRSQKGEDFNKFRKRLRGMQKDDKKNFNLFLQAIAEDLGKSIKKKLTVDVQQITSIFNKEMTFLEIVDKLDGINTNLLWLGVLLSELIDKSVKESLGKNLASVFNSSEDYRAFRDDILISFSASTPEEGYDETLIINMRSNLTSKESGQDLLKVALLGGEYDPQDNKTKKVVMDGQLIDTTFINRKVMPAIGGKVSRTFFMDENLSSDLEGIITKKLDKLKKVEKGEDK